LEQGFAPQGDLVFIRDEVDEQVLELPAVEVTEEVLSNRRGGPLQGLPEDVHGGLGKFLAALFCGVLSLEIRSPIRFE
jgi:hypothetical protein